MTAATPAPAGGPFWLTNRLVNPLLRVVLRSPLGRGVGRSLALIEYRGRRTGRRHRLVARAHRHGDELTFEVGAPGRKTWWRNFTAPGPVDVHLAGHHLVGTASARTTPEGTVVLVHLG